MQKIISNIWCNGDAEAAGNFYASVFAGASSHVESSYPSEGLADFQRAMAGKALTVSVDIGGTAFTLINAGDEFRPNPSISFFVNIDPLQFDDETAARAHLDAMWRDLSSGGRELMSLGEYPFSKHYGWVEDRYGVSWQLILTDPDGASRPYIVPSLMFAGPVQNRANEAIDFYVNLFDDAEAGSRFPYDEQTGPAAAKALAFGDFRIGDQWFAVMDSGVEQDFSFTNGVSLEVLCVDQAEIDRLWDALSAEPEAEQCGWLVDQFGVSWQIVPQNMGELMQRPQAFEHMMAMKKLVIDDF
ncbi:VOC family protein [Paramicrobacterium fandaimingii]|uniref:VOC family protein n=1 Tax=Paramicrobacterium fandaimingii TaxID=2708079 RepID=UPI0014226859|nr:VOC family protein [Microbacterium fandaimingii]